ncbi:MAG: SBBP repeat-containing protein [Crocinitomicaceae bacterium]
MHSLKHLRNWFTTCLLMYVVSFSSFAQIPSPFWVTQHGGTGQDWSHAIATDPSGNVLTVGIFQNTADFDPGPGTSNLTSNGSYDLFFQKLDPNGNLLWVKSIGGPQLDEVKTVTSDAQGNLIAAFRTSGTVDMDPGPAVLNYTTNGGPTDMYVIKLNSNGDLVWVKQFDGASSFEGLGIVTDSNDDILIAGYHFGIADFDPGVGSYPVAAMGSSDAFVLKLNQNGDFVWVKHIGGTFEDQAKAISLDTNGAILCTGYIGGVADMNPGTGVNNLTSNGDDDAFILKLDANGNYLWAKSIGGTQADEGKAVSCDNSGNVYYSGAFKGIADLDPGPGVNNVSSGGSFDVFVQKYDPNGTFLWSGNFGSNGSDFPNSMVVDSQGGVYVTGAFQLTVDFDPGPAVNNVVSLGGHEIFIQKLNSNGDFEYVMQMGGTNYDYGGGITIDDFGSILATGYFRDISDLDPGSGVNNFTSFGGYDAYVMKFDGCSPDSVTNTISTCGSYTWIDGNTYTASNNTATFTLTNSAGCDSIVTLDLTVNSPTSATDVHVACDSFTWINGVTYTTSNNSDVFAISNSVGCDSIVALDLIINNTTYGTDIHVTCNPITWIDGLTYTSSNNSATFALTNTFGCDSIVTLDLTLDPNTIDITTTTVGTLITANQTNAAYQWIDCEAGNSQISGETSNTFNATSNGIYAVIISDGLCTDTSACVNISEVGINEISSPVFVSIYPNPTSGNFKLITNLMNARVDIYSLDGKLISSELNVSENEETDHSMGRIEKGMYLVIVNNGTHQHVTRLVVE